MSRVLGDRPIAHAIAVARHHVVVGFTATLGLMTIRPAHLGIRHLALFARAFEDMQNGLNARGVIVF